MIAVHIFDTLHGNNTPSKTQQVLAGHALATFVLLAGVSLTFITKRSRTGSLLPDAAALASRALVITLIGLALNSALDPDIDVILPYYGLMFLLVIPLLRRSSRVLIGISIGLVFLAPLVVLASFNTDLPADEPTLAALIHPVERGPSHRTVPHTGVHRPQLCRSVATGRTARPVGGPGHVGLHALPPYGRVSFTDKSA
jgi:hypothetical protein